MSPDVRVVRGAPDDDELAALVAGLAAGAQPG
ncbi:acyl-CoA carboxylase epsilon subunit, partial [Actinotalea sp. C106]